MKILIDIGHPAHVHLFKHFAWEMQKNGHQIFFTCREKEFEIYLLEKYGFKYKSFGKKYSSKFGKIWGLIEFDIKEFLAGLKFKPDIFLSHGSIYAAHASFLLGKPHISLEDTGNPEQVNLYLPFTKCVLTSDFFSKDYSAKHIRYSGYHELAYLHPNYFQPDNNFFSNLNLDGYDSYVLLRFVSWKATHDHGQSGISVDTQRKILELLSEKYKVFISSEKSLIPEFEPYRVSFTPEKIHDALYYAKLFIGEGTTMAMESGILGTPSLYVNSLQYSNIDNLASYDLVYTFKNDNSVLNKINELLKTPNLKEEWQKRRQKMLTDKIDVTAFLVWFVENYPESFQIMKQNPEYQYNFR